MRSGPGSRGRIAFRGWRADLWSRVRPGHILEVGGGTGKNMPHYPEGARVMAIDVSERMLTRAARPAGHRIHTLARQVIFVREVLEHRWRFQLPPDYEVSFSRSTTSR